MEFTSVDGVRFFVESRFGKRRRTLCTPSFLNRWIGGKDSASAEGNSIRGSPLNSDVLVSVYDPGRDLAAPAVDEGREERHAVFRVQAVPHRRGEVLPQMVTARGSPQKDGSGVPSPS